MATQGASIGKAPVNLNTTFSLEAGKKYQIQNTALPLRSLRLATADTEPSRSDFSRRLGGGENAIISFTGTEVLWAWSDDGRATVPVAVDPVDD